MSSVAPTRLDCITDTGPVVRFGVQPRVPVWTERWSKFVSFSSSPAYSGNCLAPPLVELACEEGGSVHTVRREVRCRKCPTCLEHCRRQWTARAISEAQSHGRTWFATLTFDWRTQSVRVAKDQWSFARRQLTLFFKRLRKMGCKFRYLAVFEAHKDGRPHIHVLLHEKERMLWKQIDSQWIAGFHKTNLVRDIRQVAYVTKYLTKSRGLCRVRASIRYGNGSDKDRRETIPVECEALDAPLRGVAPPGAVDTPQRPKPPPSSLPFLKTPLKKAELPPLPLGTVH